MDIKRILVPLPDSAKYGPEMDLALATAKTFSACVDVLFIEAPAELPGAGGAEAARVAASMGAKLNQQNEERERRAQEAKDHFAETCKSHQVRLVEAQAKVGALPAATWRQAQGSYDKATLNRAGAYDLVVAASAAMARPLKQIAEVSLMETRRPVLLAPLRLQADLTETVMIAWDESPECWHAVSAAVPFLQRAQSVLVISIDKDETARLASQQEVVTYLGCHGVEATARVVAPQSRSIGESLLAVAGEERASLIVMGAYSRSRLREALLGGATRHVLTNAAATPVLMAH